MAAWIVPSLVDVTTASDRLEVARIALTVGAGTGGVVALVLAGRRQWSTEHDATERRITELYTKAVDQLGSDQAAVRLGGLYALERLADATPTQQGTVGNVICAYLRMPYAGPQLLSEEATEEDHKEQSRLIQELETRTTALEILIRHNSPAQAGYWPALKIRLQRSNLTGAGLAGANLAGADLTNASLTSADLTNADLSDANLTGTCLARARLTNAVMTRAYAPGANLTSADLIDANITDAILAGARLKHALLIRASVMRTNLTTADLTDANLTRADLASADLSRANMTDAIMKTANLIGADLTAANLTGTFFAQANLTDADLRGAALTSWALSDSQLAAVRYPPTPTSQQEEAQDEQRDLSDEHE